MRGRPAARSRPSGRHPGVATIFGSSPALLPAARAPGVRPPACSCRRAGNSARFHRAGGRLAGQLLARGAVLQVGGQIGVAVDGGHGRPGLLVAAVHGRPGLPVRQQVPDTMVPGGRAGCEARLWERDGLDEPRPSSFAGVAPAACECCRRPAARSPEFDRTSLRARCACGTTVPTCTPQGRGRRDRSSLGALHRGGVAPPERLAVHASQGRLFQPRYPVRTLGVTGGLGQPRRSWYHRSPRGCAPGGSVSLPCPRS